MKINYNVSAMIANNALTLNDNKLADSLQKLSSGMKIANAKIKKKSIRKKNT